MKSEEMGRRRSNERGKKGNWTREVPPGSIGQQRQRTNQAAFGLHEMRTSQNVVKLDSLLMQDVQSCLQSRNGSPRNQREGKQEGRDGGEEGGGPWLRLRGSVDLLRWSAKKNDELTPQRVANHRALSAASRSDCSDHARVQHGMTWRKERA
jgi:hypothetical protein